MQERSVVGGEKQVDGGNLIRFSDPAQGNLSVDHVPKARLVQSFADHRRVDRAGADAINPDAPRGPIHGEARVKAATPLFAAV